ncbi:hypothetical protein L0222_28905 [bacterium]|nr:hypothetical protein [bacterium]MCI0601716.1 hypothetical protein [bacterium]
MIDRSIHLPEIAAALAVANDKENLKKLLAPCASDPNAAIKMCSVLAQLYPEQSTRMAETIMHNEQ